ncbi:MAG: reductase [Pseudomonadota bacterium]
MTKTVAIIGAGQIGYAAACEFFARGWDITIHARSRPSWFQFSRAWKPYEAGRNSAPEADVVVDTIAFDEDDVARYDPDRVGRLIAVSSASVYCDQQGRTLDEGPANGYPVFDSAVTEDQATTAPGPETYSTRKVRMENAAQDRFGDRAAILRPCAIYGQYSRHLREWWFIKRMRDRRSRIPLLFDGRSQFQTTDVLKIADAAAEAAESDWSGVFNVSDTNAPSVREIGEAISQFLGTPVECVDAGDKGMIGRTPWSVPRPFIISGAKANARLYDQSLVYEDHVSDQIAWTKDLNPADWCAAFPQLAAYPWDLFDYAAEDRFFDEGV